MAVIIFALPLLMGAGVAPGACPPATHDRAALESLKASNFELAEDARRQSLALALADCLAHPDPWLRDGVAFEAIHAWLRGKQLDEATRVKLLERLSRDLAPEPPDAQGFRQPFAALTLSEVARTDRLAAWMTSAQRAALVDLAARYLSSVRDYRGFDARDGWRHGVAHGADLVTQLVLNPAVDRASLDRLLAAVALQITPPGHSYVYGEAERLARPVLYAAQRGLHGQEEWQQWLTGVASPSPMPDWGTAYQSPEGIAKRHNVMAFLYTLYANARESGNENIQRLVPGLQAVFKTL